MKELSIEEKAKAYDEIIVKAEKMHNENCDACKACIEELIPKLAESKDERIRKELLEHCKNQAKPYIQTGNKCPQIQSWIAWLEKQKQKPNYCHHEVDLSGCSEEYRKAYYDGWNNCNLQHSKCLSEGNDVVKCLINGMKFYYEGNEEATWGTEKFSMKVKDILAWLEKQGEINKSSYETVKKEKEDCVNDETNAPTEYGKYVDKCLNEASKHFFSDGEDKYSIADLFYAGVKCGKAWLKKQGEQTPKHFELKAGHWYICHHAFCCRADHLTIKEGEKFMCEKDGFVKGFVIKEPEKYFKEVCAPAPMEDEQKLSDEAESKFNIGD